MQQHLTSPIRKARQAAGLTQDALAAVLGVTKSSISAWENDKEFPASTRLGAIERALAPHFDVSEFARHAERAVGQAA